MEQLHINNPLHFERFIALNEQWIREYFSIEESDRQLAANPSVVIDKGGYILSLTLDDKVIGVCALFATNEGSFELARLAVDKAYRGKGYGDRLVTESLNQLVVLGVKKVSLMSNTRLEHALSLYTKHGFYIQHEGPHPVYKRTNIVMEKILD